ncbi:CDP-diacylglycerol--glycerol-3-phosphate 3-phosphatidyltransferase [Stieleria maiorica]|uniref:CDP-diacylglycerol--glycerol-3-phosphate 3-phosphatidyltransferase n=1 Tax=Stieleria maiorica TaxID=2795974 RepID=A0A5B9MEQ6_9BACT|nr:CDP-alcohol phosphatidyltransferase family protein [Stieleria maiorica]QEF99578.1 CDP-diacylglycerol--glycerol-3-phosphate 3-phosphatidyltransferase [Stieleria maiorica]
MLYETDRWLTLPNLVTGARIVGSPALIPLAIGRHMTLLAALALFLVFTEWLDGFLARRSHMTSSVGARLDTVADAVFYLSLLGALLALQGDQVAKEKYWMLAAIASYALSWSACLVKFRQLPSYHTWAAKGVWLIIIPATILWVAGVTPWLVRVSMVCVTLANLEAIYITHVLSQCQVDVPSLWHAKRIERLRSMT